MRCKVCGKKIKMQSDRRYEVNQTLGKDEPFRTYECFDCEYCGCQNIVNLREIGNCIITRLDVDYKKFLDEVYSKKSWEDANED